jgi:hypothetical protein
MERGENWLPGPETIIICNCGDSLSGVAALLAQGAGIEERSRHWDNGIISARRVLPAAALH